MTDIQRARKVVSLEKRTKVWKSLAHRAFRRAEKLALRAGSDAPQRLREASDTWDLW